DRRVVRAWSQRRCDRRQARRRRRRRLPHVLRARSPARAGRDGRGGTRRGSLPVRLRRDAGRVLVTLPVAIIAGGFATRLHPITETIPKSLVEVASQPFVLHQLALLRGRRVVMCLGHLGEQVEAVVGDGARHGVEAAYSYDGGQLLGTGGALRRASPLLGDAFLVL